MVSEQKRKMIRCYHLEKQRLALQSKLDELQQTIPQCKYRLRQSQEKLWGYEAVGFKSMLDKLSGKWEENHEVLMGEVRKAQQLLEAQEQERKQLTSRLDAVEQEGKSLNLGDVLEEAGALEPTQREELLQLEARLCAEKLLPILEENHNTLELAQQWARPHNQLEAVPGGTLATLLSQADALARETMELLERIAQCGILVDIHPYFMSPAGYIGGVTMYNQLDRINNALAAIRETRNQACHLLEQLSEPEEIV